MPSHAGRSQFGDHRCRIRQDDQLGWLDLVFEDYALDQADDVGCELLSTVHLHEPRLRSIDKLAVEAIVENAGYPSSYRTRVPAIHGQLEFDQSFGYRPSSSIQILVRVGE